MRVSSSAWKFIGCCKGSFSKQAAPPGPLRGDLADGVLQAVSDRRGHGRVEGIVAQHFFHGGELAGRGVLGLVGGGKLLLLLRSYFGLAFHGSISGGLWKETGGGVAGAMRLPPDGVGRLLPPPRKAFA